MYSALYIKCVQYILFVCEKNNEYWKAKHGWKIKMRHIKIVASETKSVNKKRRKKSAEKSLLSVVSAHRCSDRQMMSLYVSVNMLAS